MSYTLFAIELALYYTLGWVGGHWPWDWEPEKKNVGEYYRSIPPHVTTGESLIVDSWRSYRHLRTPLRSYIHPSFSQLFPFETSKQDILHWERRSFKSFSHYPTADTTRNCLFTSHFIWLFHFSPFILTMPSIIQLLYIQGHGGGYSDRTRIRMEGGGPGVSCQTQWYSPRREKHSATTYKSP